MKNQAYAYTIGGDINLYNVLGGLFGSTDKILNTYILSFNTSTAENLPYKVSFQYTDT